MAGSINEENCGCLGETINISKKLKLFFCRVCNRDFVGRIEIKKESLGDLAKTFDATDGPFIFLSEGRNG